MSKMFFNSLLLYSFTLFGLDSIFFSSPEMGMKTGQIYFWDLMSGRKYEANNSLPNSAFLGRFVFYSINQGRLFLLQGADTSGDQLSLYGSLENNTWGEIFPIGKVEYIGNKIWIDQESTLVIGYGETIPEEILLLKIDKLGITKYFLSEKANIQGRPIFCFDSILVVQKGNILSNDYFFYDLKSKKEVEVPLPKNSIIVGQLNEEELAIRESARLFSLSKSRVKEIGKINKKCCGRYPLFGLISDGKQYLAKTRGFDWYSFSETIYVGVFDTITGKELKKLDSPFPKPGQQFFFTSRKFISSLSNE